MSTPSREIHLVKRPEGPPTAADFAMVETTVSDPADGEVLVRNLMMSVDPAIRPRLSVQQELNEAIGGGAVGRVEKSRNPAFREGDLVNNRFGFREAFVSDGRGLAPLKPAQGVPISAYMSVLGGTGFTAYGGLLRIGALKDGEQVFVSTAAGAVGSVAAQIAKIKGCYVVGSTGSDDKARWLKETAKLDAVINYKTTPIRAALRAATPKGVDVYFENVGGAHLEAALTRMNLHGRIPVCGMISMYNGGGEGVSNLFALIYGRIRMEGFVSSDFPHLNAQFAEDMTGWLKSGRVKYQETILDGFEQAPHGLIGLFSGLNHGKMLIRVAA
jgi:hypothetical protein